MCPPESTGAAPAAPAAAASTETTTSAAGSQGNPAGAGGAPAAAGSKAPGAAAPKPELFELKVDGKTIKMTREQLLAEASKGHVSDKRFQEAAQLRKQAESVVGRLKDPNKVIESLMDPALGLTKDQIREAFEGWYAREFIEPESLSPDQKKLRESEAKLQKYQQQEQEREQQKLKDQQEAMTSQARQELQGQIIEALETGSLPKTNFTIRRLAYWIQRNNQNGFNAPTEVLVNQVRNEFNTSMRDMVENSDGETLIKLLGDSLVQKLRKYDLEQLRKLRQGPPAPAGSQETSTPVQKGERAPTSADVNQKIRQLQKTGRY